PARARGSTRLALDAAPRSVTVELAAAHALDVGVNDDVGVPVDGAELEVLAGAPLPIGGRTGPAGARPAEARPPCRACDRRGRRARRGSARGGCGRDALAGAYGDRRRR